MFYYFSFVSASAHPKQAVLLTALNEALGGLAACTECTAHPEERV